MFQSAFMAFEFLLKRKNQKNNHYADLALKRTQHLNNTWFLLFGTFYFLVIGWAAMDYY